MDKLEAARKAYLTLWWRATMVSGSHSQTSAIADASWEYIGELEAQNVRLRADRDAAVAALKAAEGKG